MFKYDARRTNNLKLDYSLWNEPFVNSYCSRIYSARCVIRAKYLSNKMACTVVGLSTCTVNDGSFIDSELRPWEVMFNYEHKK